MTDIKDTLAALSAKATQGEWYVRKLGHDHVQVHNGLEHEVLSTPRGMNAAFIVALVNLFRAGQLVPVPSVERLLEVILNELLGLCTFPDLVAQNTATAVIAAMKEGV